MTNQPPNPSREADPSREASLSREERLAAKLRENLRRRKAQARAQIPSANPPGESPTLPKTPPNS